ncbi:hypothetical protein CMV_027046, partial [Castanea mollissima]
KRPGLKRRNFKTEQVLLAILFNLLKGLLLPALCLTKSIFMGGTANQYVVLASGSLSLNSDRILQFRVSLLPSAANQC